MIRLALAFAAGALAVASYQPVKRSAPQQSAALEQCRGDLAAAIQRRVRIKLEREK